MHFVCTGSHRTPPRLYTNHCSSTTQDQSEGGGNVSPIIWILTPDKWHSFVHLCTRLHIIFRHLYMDPSTIIARGYYKGLWKCSPLRWEFQPDKCETFSFLRICTSHSVFITETCIILRLKVTRETGELKPAKMGMLTSQTRVLNVGTSSVHLYIT